MAGFLGSLGSFLSPALTVGTQAAAAYQGAEANASRERQQRQQQQVVQAIQMARQKHDDELKDALGQANIAHLGAETNKINNPAPVIKAGPNGQLFDISDPRNPRALTGGTKTKVVAPDDSVQFVDPTAPPAGLKERGPIGPQDHYTFPVAMDAGVPTVFSGNTRTGELKSTGHAAKPTGTGGGGSTGAQASLDDMVERYNEIANHAKDLADGKWKITPAMQTREGLTYGIATDNAAGKVPLRKQVEAIGMDALGIGKGGDFSRYQSLMNSTRALGDDVTKVFKGRQNESAVLREVALAQLTPDDYGNPTVVQQKLQRLQNIIKLARINNPAQAAAEHNAPATSNRPAPTSTAPASSNPFADLIPSGTDE